MSSRNVAAVVFLLVLTAAFYWRLTISKKYSWLESPDTAFMLRPWLDFEAREFHAGRFPLWARYEWGGQSLIGEVEPGVTNPLNWILFAMPLQGGHLPIGVLHWYWVCIHWLAAAFCYALCRSLKAGVAASVLGGSIYALTGLMGHTDWSYMLMSAVWLPLVFLGFARAVRGERPRSGAVLSGAALGMAFLSGHHQIPVDATVILAFLWLWFLLRGWRKRETWICAAAFTAVWLLVSAAQTLPALEYGRHALRWVNAPEPVGWRDKVPWSVHQAYSLPWKAIPGLVISNWRFYMSPFVGFTALGLAISALWFWRNMYVRLFGAAALGGLILALGTNTPAYRPLYQFFPVVEKARTPAMAIVLAQLGIAALAAVALQAWTARRPRLAWLALPIFLLEAVNAAPHFGDRERPGAYWKTMAGQEDIAEYLRTRPGWFRVQASEDDIPYNFGNFWGVEQFGAYVASIPENILHVLGRADTPRLFGVRYRIGRAPMGAEVEVFQSRSGLKVFENPAIGEPLWTVPKQPCGVEGSVRFLSREAEAMALEAEMPCAGLVVAGDPYFKGWQARVDGRAATIQEFAGVVRAVPVAAGRHRIEFRYRPRMVYWGALLTFLGALLAFAVWRAENRAGMRKHTTPTPPVAPKGVHR